MTKNKINIMIADDHDVVREGIKRIVDKNQDMEVVAEAVNGEEVISNIKKQPVDLLLLDISMPGPGFLNIMQQLENQFPEVKVLILSMHAEDNYANSAIKAGAEGYIEKNRSNEELSEAIKQIINGKRYISERLKEKLFKGNNSGIEQPPHAVLSNRELQILILIGEGMKLSEIASSLSLSPKTVSTYRSRILSKMGFRHNNELIRYTVDNQLIC